MEISSELVQSLLPVLLVTVIDASTVTVGLIAGIAEATAAVAKVISDVLSDRPGKRKFLLGLAPGHRVIDIGCGWGGLALYQARQCRANVCGIPLSKEQLSAARSAPLRRKTIEPSPAHSTGSYLPACSSMSAFLNMKCFSTNAARFSRTSADQTSAYLSR